MKKIIFILLIVLTTFSCSKKSEQTISDDSGEEIKISSNAIFYFVSSNDSSKNDWIKKANNAIIEELAKKGIKKDDHYKFIENKLNNKSDADKILKDIKAKKPSLVICTGDDALKLVGLEIEETPVVFNSITGSPEKYFSSPKLDSIDSPGHNITGVYRTAYFDESLSTMLDIKQGIKSFIILGDNSDINKGYIKIYKNAQEYLPIKSKDIITSNSFSQWKNTIKKWQGKTDLIYILSYDSVTDASPKQIQNWISKNNKLPEVGCYKSQVELGFLLSFPDSPESQGKAAVALILDILKGTSPGEISLITPGDVPPVINMARVEKLGLEIPKKVIKSFGGKEIIIK